MSLLNTAFYQVTDKMSNKDTYDGLADGLGGQFNKLQETFESQTDDLQDELIGVKTETGKVYTGIDNIDETLGGQLSFLERQLEELADINDSDERYHKSFVDYTRDSLNHTYDNHIKDIDDGAFDNLVDRMRTSILRVEMINATYDIVDPLAMIMGQLTDEQIDNIRALHHEDMLYQARMVDLLASAQQGDEEGGRGVILATKQFMRHPVWYTLTSVAGAMATVAKTIGKVGFGALFGFGGKKTVEEKILAETKRQTQFLTTGQIDDRKSFFGKLKSGGLAGLLGGDMANSLGIGREAAQSREDARAQGEAIGGGVQGFLADFLYKNETLKKGRITGSGENKEVVNQLVNANETLLILEEIQEFYEKQFSPMLEDQSGGLMTKLTDLSAAFEGEYTVISEEIRKGFAGSSKVEKDNVAKQEESLEQNESIISYLKRQYGEAKKTNRHLLMAKLMAVMSGIGSLFTGLMKGGAFKLLGVGLGAIAFKNMKDGILDGEQTWGKSLITTVGASFAGLMIAGIAGAKVGAALSVGVAVGTFLNNNIINPFIERLTGREGETLGSALWEWFHGTGVKDAQKRSEKQIETGDALMGGNDSGLGGDISWEEYEKFEKNREERGNFFSRSYGTKYVKSDQFMKDYKNQLMMRERAQAAQQTREEDAVHLASYEESLNDVDLNRQHGIMLRDMGMKIDPSSGQMTQDTNVFGRDRAFSPSNVENNGSGINIDSVTKAVSGSVDSVKSFFSSSKEEQQITNRNLTHLIEVIKEGNSLGQNNYDGMPDTQTILNVGGGY